MNKNSSEIQNSLAAFLKSQGVEIFAAGSIAAIKKDFLLANEMDLEGIDYAISIAYPLASQALEGIVDRPTLLYKHLYRQVNNLLDRAAVATSVWLQSLGAKAIPIPASQMVDWEKNLAHLSHRQIAAELGLGFYGRNNLLVTPQYGSQVRLATILTDFSAEIPGPAKTKKYSCEKCAACVMVCPVKAIHTGPQDFDRAACFAQTREFEKMRGISVRICGICVRACPGPKE
jgi:epoxyqueuosine reductase QueG